MHPTCSGLPPSSSLRSWLLRLPSLTMQGHQVSRAPLPATSVTYDRMVSSTTSKSVTSSSSLVRAHAPNQLPPPDFVFPHLFPEVFAGCCEPLLRTGSSRRYLCKSFPGCLSHDPVGFVGCMGLFLPLQHRPSPSPSNRSASPNLPAQRDFMRKVFRDRRYFLRSGLLVCSPPRSPLPLRLEGRRAAVTFTPEQIMHRYLCMHRVC
jgi:hypothetical protein